MLAVSDDELAMGASQGPLLLSPVVTILTRRRPSQTREKGARRDPHDTLTSGLEDGKAGSDPIVPEAPLSGERARGEKDDSPQDGESTKDESDRQADGTAGHGAHRDCRGGGRTEGRERQERGGKDKRRRGVARGRRYAERAKKRCE